MNTKSLFFFAYLILGIFTSCETPLEKPTDSLPPATQEGKRTFGFLLNGKPWTPKGDNGTPNLYLSYDPGLDKGLIRIAAYRIISDAEREYFYMYASNLESQKEFSLHDPKLAVANFSRDLCYYRSDPIVIKKGKLTITKFDIPNHIISGTFESTLVKPGCDTIRITDGRFDLKF